MREDLWGDVPPADLTVEHPVVLQFVLFLALHEMQGPPVMPVLSTRQQGVGASARLT